MSVTLGLEQLQPAGGFVLLLNCQGLLDFLELDLHKLGGIVSFGVYVCENLEGLFGLSLGNVPTRRFGN